MIRDPARRGLLANLSLVAQGIWPEGMPFRSLASQGLAWPVWQSGMSFAEFGLTQTGNLMLSELLCEELGLNHEHLLGAAGEIQGTAAEIAQGKAFLAIVTEAVRSNSPVAGGFEEARLAQLAANASPGPMRAPDDTSRPKPP